MLRIAGFGLAVLMLTSNLFAEEQPKEDVTKTKEEIKAYINALLEAGKSDVYFRDEKDTTKDGQIIRLFIVGTSTISASLGLEEGLEIAQERAEEAAKAAFVKFLGSKVTIKKTVNNQIILTKEGEEGPNGENVKEQAKKVERRTKEFEETASGIVKGLKVAGTHQNIKDKKLIVVYRWEMKNLGGIDKINDKLNPSKDPAKKDDSKEPTTDPKKTTPKDSTKPIPDKKIIIDD